MRLLRTIGRRLVLRLRGEQIETLWEAALPVEMLALPRDLARLGECTTTPSCSRRFTRCGVLRRPARGGLPGSGPRERVLVPVTVMIETQNTSRGFRFGSATNVIEPVAAGRARSQLAGRPRFPSHGRNGQRGVLHGRPSDAARCAIQPPGAVATEWDETRRVLETAKKTGSTSLVFSVAPSKIFAFGKGIFSQTRYHF
jgi:hypothetical protein